VKIVIPGLTVFARYFKNNTFYQVEVLLHRVYRLPEVVCTLWAICCLASKWKSEHCQPLRLPETSQLKNQNTIKEQLHISLTGFNCLGQVFRFLYLSASPADFFFFFGGILNKPVQLIQKNPKQFR